MDNSFQSSGGGALLYLCLNKSGCSLNTIRSIAPYSCSSEFCPSTAYSRCTNV